MTTVSQIRDLVNIRTTQDILKVFERAERNLTHLRRGEDRIQILRRFGVASNEIESLYLRLLTAYVKCKRIVHRSYGKEDSRDVQHIAVQLRGSMRDLECIIRHNLDLLDEIHNTALHNLSYARECFISIPHYRRPTWLTSLPNPASESKTPPVSTPVQSTVSILKRMIPDSSLNPSYISTR